MRLVFVSNTAWSIYNYRQGLLRALRARGVELTVIAPRDTAFAALTALGCDCIDLPVSAKGTNPLADLRTLGALWRHYRRLRPDTVFHYTIKPNIYGSLAARLAGVASVAVTTGLGYVFIQPSAAARVARRLYRLAFRFPREVWFLNRDDHQAFVEHRLLAHPERARILHGEGIDLQHFALTTAPTPRPGEEVVFLLIGRLLWDKGVGEYVEAARRLKVRWPRSRWQLLGPVGAANPSAISAAQVRAWQDEGVIEYLGEAADVRPHIAAADCIVLPSYREGVPRTLLEALALARPVVATDVPGCRETVDDGLTGLLCRARDAGDLADKMAAMVAMDAGARAAMGMRGRRKAEREFDEKVVIERYFDTLAAIAGKVPG
jgi:glycosyltransferase involved in cell wall biosynthesis